MGSKEVFAKGYSGKKLFLVFVIGSMLGTFYEQILNLVKVYLKIGDIVWELRRGVLYGPFNPLYGLGTVLVIYLLARPNYSNIKTFIYGSLLGGFIEYSISLLQEIFTHTTSWNYSHYFLNINGRTTIPYMLVWGLFTLIIVKVIYPYLSNWIEKIPIKVGNIIFYSLLIFLIIDMAISFTALIRSALRRNNVEPITPVGRLYDKVYPDNVLQDYFPNMSFEVRKEK